MNSPEFELLQNNFVKCQNCKHLTKEGLCSALDRVRPMVNALRHCDAFDVQVSKRDAIEERILNSDELKDAYSRVARPFFNHLKGCKKCDFEKSIFCDAGKELSLDRDSVLLCFEDAEAKNKAFIHYLKKSLQE